jgi:hypothetical protein
VRIADPEMGDAVLSHALDLDQSPGTVQSGNPSLIFHSGSVNQKPVVQVVQATLQSKNNAALPATITVPARGHVSFRLRILSSSRMSLGRGAEKARRRPVWGWVKARWAACKAGRGKRLGSGRGAPCRGRS